MRIGKHLFVIKLPLFRKEGGRGRFNYSNLFKINLPKPLFTKEGLFYDIAFSGFIGNIFDRVKNGEGLWAIKLPLFRKEGAGGDSLFQLIQNQFPHHFNMRFFSIQCGDVVIRHATMI